jgi:predicted NBD/HSP70 family sugar kinase
MAVKPTLDLLRSLTDEQVLRSLMTQGQATRAELATRTGLSKPTVSESIRRLGEADLVRDTGERTSGRGRVGTYYGLPADLGVALAISIAPEGIVAEALTATGAVTGRGERMVSRPAAPREVSRALRAAVTEAQAGAARTRLAVVSAADPVDRRSGRLVHLEGSPFLVGELSPARVLHGLVDGPVLVDNDVNWAARAERDATRRPSEDFAYLYLGDGVGGAIVLDGDVRRGHTGLAGEIAHALTVGPRGEAMPFLEVFGKLGLRRPGSTAVDVERLLAALNQDSARSQQLLRTVAMATAGVLGAILAVADPEVVVLGGPWGTHPRLIDAVRECVATLGRGPSVRAAQILQEPSLAGARAAALEQLRSAIVSTR